MIIAIMWNLGIGAGAGELCLMTLFKAAVLVLGAELCVGSYIYNMRQLALKGGEGIHCKTEFFNWRLSGDK